MLTFVEATEEHAQFLTRHLREEEVLEVQASSRREQIEDIRLSIGLSSEAWAALWNGEVVAVLGIRPLSFLSNDACPWLLTTPEAAKHPKELLRSTKKFLNEWIQQYDVLTNYIDSRYEPSLRWAKWAGFEVFPPKPFGPFRTPFNKIEIRRETWALKR
jgi:hypothetical protein